MPVVTIAFLQSVGLPDHLIELILQRAGPKSLSVVCALSKADLEYISKRQNVYSSAPFNWYV